MNRALTHCGTAGRQSALLDPIAASPAWLRRSLDGLTADFRPRIPASLAPTNEQRAVIQDRLARLSSRLSPAPVDEIGARVARLQAAFPSAALTDASAIAYAESYLEALAGVPAYALDEACRQVVQGRAPGIDRRFMPAAPVLRALVDELSRPARWHARQLRRLLDAEVEREITPEERARVAERFQSLVSGAARG